MPSFEIIQTYEKLFQGIWVKTVPTLGVTSFAAMLERALFVAQQKYLFLSKIKVRSDGVSLDELKKPSLEPVSEADLENGLREYVTTLVSILAKIMGEVISGEVKKLIDSMVIAKTL